MNTLTVVVFAACAAVASAGLLGAPLAAPAYATYGGVGQLSSATTSLNSGTYKTRVSQSARPVAFAAPALAPAYAPAAYAAPAYAAPIAHAVAAPAIAHPAYAAPAIAAPAALAAPVAAGHVVTAFGYTPAATALLG